MIFKHKLFFMVGSIRDLKRMNFQTHENILVLQVSLKRDEIRCRVETEIFFDFMPPLYFLAEI